MFDRRTEISQTHQGSLPRWSVVWDWGEGRESFLCSGFIQHLAQRSVINGRALLAALRQVINAVTPKDGLLNKVQVCRNALDFACQ